MKRQKKIPAVIYSQAKNRSWSRYLETVAFKKETITHKNPIVFLCTNLLPFVSFLMFSVLRSYDYELKMQYFAVNKQSVAIMQVHIRQISKRGDFKINHFHIRKSSFQLQWNRCWTIKTVTCKSFDEDYWKDLS